MKKKLILLFLVFILVGCSSSNSAELQVKDEEISKLQSELEEANEKINRLTSELETANSDLKVANLKLEEAKPWFEMADLEREQKAKELEEQKEKEAALIAEQKAKEAAEKAAKEEAERIAKEQEEKKGYDTGITYNQLARTPDDFEFEKVKFRGKVIQVMEGDSETQIRLAVNSNYDTIIYCGIPKELTSNNRVLEDDVITVYGVSYGLLSYKSTLGGTITIPSVLVDKFEY